MITLFTGYDEEDIKKAQESLAAEEAGEGEKKSGFFSRMREAVTRTRENFSSRINDVFALTREFDESSL
jgi:fused signal recognition particle receptor